MTEAEHKLMQEHVKYWRELTDKGVAIVFGPVADPNGVWGLAIVEVEDKASAHALGMDDPVIKAKSGFNFEVYPMPQGIITRK
ncbi:MAG TPA: YciI family protein [Nitrososphaera sp.]|nr:YciI family protein [Nitrososphaera sp.]